MSRVFGELRILLTGDTENWKSLVLDLLVSDSGVVIYQKFYDRAKIDLNSFVSTLRRLVT